MTAPRHKPEPPAPPDPSDCCGGGCVRCVYDVYDEQLAEWRALCAEIDAGSDADAAPGSPPARD